MAKKEDNYSWLDNYSTDPRDTVFDDITQRHQDRVARNRDRDAHDRENDASNLSWAESDSSGIYDDLVFDASRAASAPPDAPATPAAPSHPAPAPPPPSFSKRAVARTAAPPPPPPAEQPQLTEPQRLPRTGSRVLAPSPKVRRLRQPVPIPNAELSLFERLRRVPLSAFLPFIFIAVFVVASMFEASDNSSSVPPAIPASQPAETPIITLGPGDCFLAPPTPGSSRVASRSCNQPHGGEVIAFAPGDVDEAQATCETARQELDLDALSRLPDDASFTILLNPPNSRCAIVSPSTSLIGSVLRPG